MVNFNDSSELIENFIQSSINKFILEEGTPSSVGVYCCPWAGWITTNFNINSTLEETENNCPDFEFVEYEIIDLENWEDEYTQENPVFLMNGNKIFFQHESTDKFNGLVFSFLLPIVKKIKDKNDMLFILQMLDSEFVQVVE